MISFINLSHQVGRIAFRAMCVSAAREESDAQRVRAHSHWSLSHEARRPTNPASNLAIICNSFHCRPPILENQLPSPHPFKMFLVRFIQLEIILQSIILANVWRMENATKLISFNSFLVPLSMKILRRFFPLPIANLYPFNRHPVGYALPRLNLYPLGGGILGRLSARKSSRWNWSWAEWGHEEIVSKERSIRLRRS